MISKGRHKVKPRENRKFNYLCHNMDDMYKYFAKCFPNMASEVDSKTYKEILKDLNKLLQQEIVNGRDFSFPETNDVIGVRKRRIILRGNELDKRAIHFDYKNAKRLGKDVRYLNEHSDFFMLKIKWFKPRSYNPDATKKHYSFQPCREMKTGVANQGKKEGGHTIYFQIR